MKEKTLSIIGIHIVKYPIEIIFRCTRRCLTESELGLMFMVFGCFQ